MENLKNNHIFDKIYGGWLGKCLGGAAGAPVEGIKRLITEVDYKQVIRPDLPNDDLDLQLLWFEVMEQQGLLTTAESLADAWNQKCWYPFNEYGYFLKNYDRGIMPPYSGSFNNTFFSESEGCPIRSEIWGMIFPGNPERAAEFAEMDGSLDHSGNAVWIEMFYAALEAAAFKESDISKLLQMSAKYLPEGSQARNCMQDVIAWNKKWPDDWKMTWKYLTKNYLHNDFTNAVINYGIVLTALLYGENDLDQVIRIAFSSGFDTDCTCATAGAVWGIIHGYSQIPESLRNLVNDEFTIGINVTRSSNSIRQLAVDTYQLAEKLKNEKRESSGVKLEVEYLSQPALGSESKCMFRIQAENCLNQTYNHNIQVQNIPDGWKVHPENIPLILQSGEKKNIEFEVCLDPATRILRNINILNIKYGEYEKKIGIAGAAEWTAAGPFFEPLVKPEPEGIPSPHGEGCNLPSPECMINNAVYLTTEYLDEICLAEAIDQESCKKIVSCEDLIPLDETFSFQGQGCIYLKQTIFSESDQTLWAVIGNNDGFRLWINGQLSMEKDEIRLWTPYNNYNLIHLKRGENEIILKLLKRTENIKFSIGMKKYDGNHFHRTRWCTDLACKINRRIQ